MVALLLSRPTVFHVIGVTVSVVAARAAVDDRSARAETKRRISAPRLRRIHCRVADRGSAGTYMVGRRWFSLSGSPATVTGGALQVEVLIRLVLLDLGCWITG